MTVVLVTAASKYGATAEIAQAIGETLIAENVQAQVRAIADVEDVGGYDAVVLGSAVYVGHWLKPAIAFARTHGTQLRARATWLFSSGPIGEPPRPRASDAVDVEQILAATSAREHRLFAGRIDKSRLSFPDRAVMRAVGAADGDYRDWDEIRAWAVAIATSLKS